MSFKRRVTSWTQLNRMATRNAGRDDFRYPNEDDIDPKGLFKRSSMTLLGNQRNGSEPTLYLDEPSTVEGAKRFMKFMYESWEREKLCDVILHVQNGEQLSAHKVALGAYSDTLAEEFDRYPKNEVISVDLSEFSKAAVRDFLYFVYTTKVIVGSHNIRELLTIAIELEVTVLLEICMSDLSNYNVENALFYYSILQDIDVPDLRSNIYHFMCEHFVDIVNTDEFLEITYEQLYYFVNDSSIRVDSELDLFLAIVRWIDFNRAERLCTAPVLLQSVRFHKISPEVLVSEVEVETHIFEMMECHYMLYEAMKWHALDLSANIPTRYADTIKTQVQRSGVMKSSHTEEKQVYRNTTERKVVSKGISGERTPKSPKMGTGLNQSHWFGGKDTVREVNQRLAGSSTGYTTVTGTSASEGEEEKQDGRYTVQKNIYVDGDGEDHYVSLSPNIELHTPKRYPISPVNSRKTQNHPDNSGLSTSVESMLKPHDHSLSTISPVCVGGLDVHSVDAEKPGRCVYQYNAEENSWSLLTRMPMFRHHHAAVVVAGKLCILGGAVYNKRQPDKLGTATGGVAVYDRAVNQWSEATPMQHKRAYLGAVAHGSKIYAIGGEDDSKTKLASVEVYCATYDSWKFLQALRGGAKIGIAVCVYRNCMWVVGGYNPDRPDGPLLRDVECYDFCLQRWMPKNALHLPICHANLAVCMGKMYLVGGRTQKPEDRALTSLTSVYEYDDLTDSWRHASDMSIARHDSATCVVGTRLYIMGGMQTHRSTCLDSVECFDTRTYTWLHNIAPLPQPAAGLAGCTL